MSNARRFDVLVLGSKTKRLIWPLGQAAKTTPSHGVIGSSILPGVTKTKYKANRFLRKFASLLFFIALHRFLLADIEQQIFKVDKAQQKRAVDIVTWTAR